MDYGKRITTESYENGEVSRTKKEIEQSVMVHGKNQVLSEVMDTLEIKSTVINFTIHKDPVTYEIKRVVKKWQTENRRTR